jgi:death-on-curing protein
VNPPRILLPTPQFVIETNRRICTRDGSLSQCLDRGKVESAVAAAFYPGAPPFVHGGVATLAGALCFYLVQAHAFLDGNKRTALATAATFLRLNGWRLMYPLTPTHNALADIVEQCGASHVGKEQLMAWFDSHKAPL